MKMKIKKENAITLIALVITIIVLLILAGLTISTLSGQNGLLKRADDARNRTNYEIALEKVKLKITEANTKRYHENNRSATLEELKEYFADENEIDILVKKYLSSASESSDINQIIGTLKGMEIQAVGYEQYIFLIGENCLVESVSIDEGNSFIEIDKFDPVNNINKNETLDTDIPEETPDTQGRLYVYNQGNKYVDTGAGFEGRYYSGTNSSVGSYSFEENYIELNTWGTWCQYNIGLNRVIDITDYSSYGVEIYDTSYINTGYDAIDLVVGSNIQVNYLKNGVNSIYTMDISQITGENKLEVGSANGAYFKISKIWLEKNGEKVYLYNQGEENTSIINVWSGGYTNGTNSALGTYTIQDNYMELNTWGTWCQYSIGLNRVIDITDYSSYGVEIYDTSYINTGYDAIDLVVGLNIQVNYLKNGVNSVYTMDISQITGENKLMVGSSNGAHFKIKSIWLEK